MTIYRTISSLHPKLIPPATALREELRRGYETGRTKTLFQVFETYRDPIRQAELLAKGASKAGPWQSPHQFGMAVDFVPFITPEQASWLGNEIGERVAHGWNWNDRWDWAFLKAEATKVGLRVPIQWDLCHVEYPNWRKLLP